MRGLIGDLCIKTYLVNQNPAKTCQVLGKNFSGQLYTKDLLVSFVTLCLLCGNYLHGDNHAP
jgi:hypothetical protein